MGGLVSSGQVEGEGHRTDRWIRSILYLLTRQVVVTS